MDARALLKKKEKSLIALDSYIEHVREKHPNSKDEIQRLLGIRVERKQTIKELKVVCEKGQAQ